MGFDNECILNIQSLAGEYFCPVCRLLVYPNEALQSQCTHLYCKPCLTYVVSTTRACPYDGYLVTEADSKPLVESNKALADTIGKIAVHCLYHRSGCQWQGPLSECTSHCSGCTFGNSPVVCNRCGIQIVHRQVQEHAQNCPGVQPQAAQVEGAQEVAVTATATATASVASSNAEQTQTPNQSGSSTSQSQTSLIVAAPPTGQDPNQPANVNPHAQAQAQAVASAAVPTQEQWYQQQYQQYYHQYPGYDPYQQPYQNYYPYQQQAVQQYQQYPAQVHGQQLQVSSQAQPQSQTNSQSQPQMQPQPLPQTHQPQTQPQPLQHVQAPPVAQTFANPQHQPHPAVQPHTQMQSQAHPPAQPQPYPQAQPQQQPHPVQPHSQQHMPIPQYQPPQSQIQNPQLQIQPRPHSQVHPQHPLLQPQPQQHLQAQPQAPLQPQLHPRPQVQAPPHLNQPPTPNPQSQTQPPAHGVTCHQSYPQPQAHHQMQLGAQHPPHMHSQSGPIPQHPVQMHGQFPQQPPQMRPPQTHAPVPNQQQPVTLPSHGQVPGISPLQQPSVHPHAQQPGLQRPVMQPMQQPPPQQYLQHQQPFPGQISGPVQQQLLPHGHFMQQQPTQPQLRPQGPPHMVQQNSQAYMSSQQSFAQPHGLQPSQVQNYTARPMMPNHGQPSQPFAQTSAGFAGASQVRPMQAGANQQPADQSFTPRMSKQLQASSEHQIVQSGLTLKPTVHERQGDHMPEKSVADKRDGLPFQETREKEPNGLLSTSGRGDDSAQEKNLKAEIDSKSMDVVQKPVDGDEDNNNQVDLHGKETYSESNAAGNASSEPAVKHMVEKEGNETRLESSPGGKSCEIAAPGNRDATELLQRGEHSVASDGTSSQQAVSVKEQNGKLPKDAAMLVPGGPDKGSEAIPLTARDHLHHSSQERSLTQAQPSSQGLGADEFRSLSSHGQVPGKSFMNPAQPFPPTDQGRHQNVQMGYGPSYNGQMPGQPSNILRPQGPGHLPQPGQPLNPADRFQPPGVNYPPSSFHPEIAPGGIPGPSSASFGRGPGHFGPAERSLESQLVAPQGYFNQGHVPPSQAGSFNSQGGLMGRAPPYGLEGKIVQQRPINPIESDTMLDQRSRHLDGSQPDSHLLGSLDRAPPFGQPPGIESNMMRMNGPPGVDSSSKVGLEDERFNRHMEEGFSRFPMERARHVDRGELEEDLKRFPRHPHLDNEPAEKLGGYFSSSRANNRGPHGFAVDDKVPYGLNYNDGLKVDPNAGGAPRFLPPFHPGGSNDAGDRPRPVGPDNNIGRVDPTRSHPDFLGPVPGFGGHHMDRLAPRSPGREYPAFPPREFGGHSGLPHNQPGLHDHDGREPRPFGEGSRSFNFPSDPFGKPFHESRFPPLSGHSRRGEFDGAGNVRGSDLVGQDILPSHLRRGDILGPRNLRGHLHFGEPAGFGAFPGHARPGDLPSPGSLQHHPHGEPFGGSRSGHPRLGEPGFRSSYSLTGGMDPFDNSRKRKLASSGWCRICKVDCETVEGLDLHSQTREHQKMAMDMVLSIKQQNAKKLKTSNEHPALEEASKSRGSNFEVRGNKP